MRIGRQRLVAVVLAVLAIAATIASSATTSARAAPPDSGTEVEAPQLSIAIDNGRTEAAVGDTLDYAITIKNLGPDPTEGLHVTQTMPVGLTFESADSDGAAGTDEVAWTLDLEAHAEVVVHSSMVVTATPAELLRLATVACVNLAADGPPLICAAHSDQLPAGANAASEAAADGQDISPRLFLIGGSLIVLIGLAIATVMLRRRKSARAAASRSVTHPGASSPSTRRRMRGRASSQP